MKDRPSVVFAYTVKGWGLPIAGNPRNHSALLSGDQIDDAARRARPDPGDRVGPDRPGDPGRAVGGARREHAGPRAARAAARRSPCPETTGMRAGKPISTQEVFGRVLVDLSRDEGVAPLSRHHRAGRRDVDQPGRLHQPHRRLRPDRAALLERGPVLKWAEGPTGQHIELGISEMNLFLLLGQLGLSWDLSGQPLLPVGTVYDPFVLRGLDAFIYGDLLRLAVRRRRHARRA